jgi:putative transposase
MKKALTHISLELANPAKLEQLEPLAEEYLRVCQFYVDHLIAEGARKPKEYADLPRIETTLSARWQRCSWQQACGIVQSWFSNERTNSPVLKKISLQGNANVIRLEKSKKPEYDYWLRVSTLVKGKPVYLPIKLHKYATETIAEWEKLSSSVRLNKQGGRWYATFVVEKPDAKEKKIERVVGVDIGIKSTVATSDGQEIGHFSDRLKRKLEGEHEQFRRKQKLNACLSANGLPEVEYRNRKVEAFTRNEINCALNQLIDELVAEPGVAVAKERLSVAEMKFKSREMNRLLRTAQLGYIERRLEFKLNEAGIRYRSVQPAYSSQQCQACGFTLKENRKSQAEFECLFCGYRVSADVNAAVNLAERFGDDELNKLHFREVKGLLAKRFLQAHPQTCGTTCHDGRSPSSGLDAESTCTMPSAMQPLSPVNARNIFPYPK